LTEKHVHSNSHIFLSNIATDIRKNIFEKVFLSCFDWCPTIWYQCNRFLTKTSQTRTLQVAMFEADLTMKWILALTLYGCRILYCIISSHFLITSSSNWQFCKQLRWWWRLFPVTVYSYTFLVISLHHIPMVKTIVFAGIIIIIGT